MGRHRVTKPEMFRIPLPYAQSDQELEVSCTGVEKPRTAIWSGMERDLVDRTELRGPNRVRCGSQYITDRFCLYR
jgi:hypothetical protein